MLILCYLLSFYLLTYAVKELPLAMVYASWSVQSIVLVIFFGLFLHRQSLPWQGPLGLVLIVIRVVVVNLHLRSWKLDTCSAAKIKHVVVPPTV